MQYTIIGIDGTDDEALARPQAVLANHFKLREELLAAGNLGYCAAQLNYDVSMKGSMYVVSFKTKEELQEYLKSEPYVTGNVWQDIEVHKSNTRDPWQYCHEKSRFEENSNG